MSRKNWNIDCISIAQVRWNTKRLFNSDTDVGVFSRKWIKRKKKSPAREGELTYVISDSKFFISAIEKFRR